MGAINDIRVAIVAKVAGLGLSLTGELYFGRVPEKTAFPYGRFNDVSNVPEYDYGTTSHIDHWVYQFDVWDTSRPNVAAMLEALHDGLHRQPLTLTSGTHLMTLRKSSGITIEPNKDKQAAPVYRGRADFEFTVQT